MQGRDLPRSLFAQLQQGQTQSANITQSLQNAQHLGKPQHPLTDMDRLMLERQISGAQNPTVRPSLNSLLPL